MGTTLLRVCEVKGRVSGTQQTPPESQRHRMTRPSRTSGSFGAVSGGRQGEVEASSARVAARGFQKDGEAAPTPTPSQGEKSVFTSGGG